jgi:hypothetical protein
LTAAFFEGHGSPRWQDGATEPFVETCQQVGQSGERLDHETVEQVVEEAPFERDQKESLTRAIRLQYW